MIIRGSLNSNKTELLIEQYVQLIKSGENYKSILFLTLNSHKKEKIVKTIKSYFPTLSPIVHTFLGLCYNSILDNETLLQEKIPQSNKKEFNLCGLEVSHNLLLKSIKEIGFKDYNSKINLVHQLLRRHALIVNNNLSDKQVEEKDKILNESFANEAKKALDLFKTKTIESKTFDYLRQQSLFKWLYENTGCCKHIKYIFIDDYDEQTPACTDFFKHIKPTLNDYYIGIDDKGSSRYGFLCADLMCNDILKKETNIIVSTETNTKPIFQFFNFSKRLEMLKTVISTIETLINNGTELNEISIISPLFDNQLKFILKNNFTNKKIPVQFISGSEKLSDDNLIRSVLNLLKLINGTEKEVFANTDILNNIFPILLNIPQKYTCEIIKKFQTTRGFFKYDFKDDKLNQRYQKLLDFANSINPQDTLSSQLEKIYSNFITIRHNKEKEILNYNFLVKQIKDLESIIEENDKSRIINQIWNSIISENDENGFQIENNAITIGTPQKIIDYEIKTKYQFWLDISNDEWIKQDTGTIYNAWVFARNWTKKEFTYEDSLNCIKTKTSRILRKLSLLVTDKIFAYSTNYDSLGLENNIGITNFLDLKNGKSTIKINPSFNFVPREDQKPILNYEKGKMALSAVPGAGKTTVLQALIIKLINQGIPPANIFILTYMESAAKTLKDRLLQSLVIDETNSSLNVLPNISTIHGLALRIIKENGNFSTIGLNDDFEICDETLRQKIIRDIIGQLKLNYEDYDKYDKAISIAKFVEINSTPKNKELNDFLTLYKEYKTKLLSKNLIDYDDMLIYAVKILEENPQILTYYQNICEYILEDEAQDSSAIQQKLISLLSSKNGNVIRCGDINQAITSTFTNSDTIGFKNFIKNNFSVEMNCSQRCASGIYSLANDLIDYANNELISNEAFYNIKIQGVNGKNPTSQNPIVASIYEDEIIEQNELINKIKKIFQANETATIAVLVRNNFQVAKYSTLLKENGIKVISKSDYLEQNKIFNIIVAILKFCIYPWKNNLVHNVYKILFNESKDNNYLENLETPFITIDVGTLEDEKLIALQWELGYWLAQNNLPLEQLALKIGEYHCENDIDHSNLYIISELIRRFSQHSTSYTEIITKLEQISKRPTIAGLKLFSEDDYKIYNSMGGNVQIMTIHKSKGDEFDYVFMPEFTEKNLSTTLENIKLSNNIGFFEDIKTLDKKYIRKTREELKKEILHENLRLLYVAITRAKRNIFFSTALKQKIFGKIREVEKSKLFDTFLLQYVK